MEDKAFSDDGADAATLQGTVLDIRHTHLNMPIEVPEVRPAFADRMGIPGRRPDLVIRFGRR